MVAQAPDNRYWKAATIAEQENIPAHFMEKILQQLARKGLLQSCRGPHGGFLLNVPPARIRLLDIVHALSAPSPSQLDAAGMNDCAEGWYCCSMIEGWTDLQNEIQNYLTAHTVADLAKSQEVRRRVLAMRAGSNAGGVLTVREYRTRGSSEPPGPY